MQQRVYQTKIRYVDELPKRLLNVWHWHSIEQCTIDSSIIQWHPQLKACICAKGGHLKHSVVI